MKTYSREEIYKSTLEYFNGDELATNTWINKYCLKDSFDNFYELNPDEMHKRLTKEIARIELNYENPLLDEEIYEVLKNFKYIIPGGGSMTGIGNDFQISSLSNCFVVGNMFDSYGGILLTDQQQIQLMKRRGGVGHDLSHIRPAGTPVKNSALTSTGIVPFMERYSNSTREVAQDGRRGALMLSVSIKHPDSEKFIDAKLEQGKVTGANISVKIHDDFMNSVINDKPFIQQFPIDSNAPTQTKEIDPRRLWDKIVHNAWKSAEPGILFWDKIISESPADCYADDGFTTTSTNPCGEIPLCPYDSCRLIALNLLSYVNNPYTKEATFDFDLFKKHVKLATRIMDDIIDLEIEKIDKIIEKIEIDTEPDYIKSTELDLWTAIREMALKGRRTGIGITSEGDMLAALGLRYGSDNATTVSDIIHKTLSTYTYIESIRLAKLRGSFSVWNYEKEINNPFINRILINNDVVNQTVLDDYKKYGRRNISLLTIAPTGCVDKNTQIITDHGIMSMEEIFDLNGIKLPDLYNKKNIWFDLIYPLSVQDINGNYHNVNKLYWNGLTDGYELKFGDDSNRIVSKVHKFLVLSDNNKGIWKTSEELEIGDKIIKLKNISQ
jgi:ribonucleoside-diphosphate reductase alpha chain